MRKFYYALPLIAALAFYMLPQVPADEERERGKLPHGEADKKFVIDDQAIDRTNTHKFTSYADVLDNVTPAVVSVYPARTVTIEPGSGAANPLEELLRRYYGLPPRQQQPSGRGGDVQERKVPYGIGSGVIISEDGYIVTNHHVVTDESGTPADEIQIELNDDQTYTAILVGSDPKTDVAVLKVEAKGLPFLKMANSENLRVGDIVFAVGNPLHVGTTVTMGIVSATGRTELGILGAQAGRDGYENFIQTDASINPGNSGGALVDADGRLVGINSAILSGTGGNIGIGFAIPITIARNIVVSLIETGAIQRGFLGVRISDLNADMAEAFGLESTKGALVQQVEPGLPAERGGVERGDIIIQVDEREISSADELRLTVSQIRPGITVKLTLMRKGKVIEKDVILGNLEDPFGYSSNNGTSSKGSSVFEGVETKALTAELRESYSVPDDIQGVVVTKISGNSPFADVLREGLVIIEINDKPARNPATAAENLRKGVNKLWVYDRSGYGYIAVRVQ